MSRSGGKRHFERKGGVRRAFRVVETKGARLLLTFGRAVDDEAAVDIPCASAAEAERVARRWAELARQEGFAEVDLGGARPGILFYFKPPRGPCRVTLDDGTHVYVAEGAAKVKKLKVGGRVLVHGLHRNPKLKADIVFGSKQQAETVTDFPDPDWSRIRLRPQLKAADRRRLQRLAGPALLGHQEHDPPLRDAGCGDLIFAYDKGVHRFLKFERTKECRLAIYEPVFSANFKWQAPVLLRCADVFCRLLPRTLRREIDRAVDASSGR